MNNHRTRVSPAPRPRRWPAAALACVCLLGVGVALGTRLASPDPAQTATVTVTTPATATAASPADGPAPVRGAARTQRGAVVAAAQAVSALDGTALLDRARLRALVGSLASAGARARLTVVYERTAVEARVRLGLDSVPVPVVFVRAVPVGYRLDRFTDKAATVAVWRVGIVGSGATVEPQQSWRTVAVSLVWEHGRWKVAAFASSPGPTPPLGAAAPSTATELFASVPRFKEFTSANP